MYKLKMAYIPVVRRGNCQWPTMQAGVLSEKLRLKESKNGQKGRLQYVETHDREIGFWRF